MDSTPKSNRTHITIYGRTNSGKSSLINAIAGEDVAIVSDICGTTTDVVRKMMELPYGIGPTCIMDTPGYNDCSALGDLREEATRKATATTDIGIVIFTDEDIHQEMAWINYLRNQKIPVISVIGKCDAINNLEKLYHIVENATSVKPIAVSAINGTGIDNLLHAISEVAVSDDDTIIKDLATKGDVVLLVMPQDISAPKGRLIMPQVQTIRNLLDNKSIIISVTADQLESGLAVLSCPPKLIITDSQMFKEVYELKPKETAITSFSVLYAAYKGDLDVFLAGAEKIDHLSNDSKILIAEACSHTPLNEDIGRVKIPNLLRQKYPHIKIDHVNGADYPTDLSPYDLVIHCGGCMFTRKHVMTRVTMAKEKDIAITNYGIFLAHWANILDKIILPAKNVDK